MNIHTKEAYAEVDEFIRLLGTNYSDKIPKKLRRFFEEEKSRDYIVKINPDIPIKEQNLKEETLAIIALLNLKYWCEDEKEKERLQKIYAQNEEIYQKMLQEKYNPDNLFKKSYNNINSEEASEELQMVKYEPIPFYKKIINKIKAFFKLKK